MNHDKLYSIRNLECSYNGNPPVLKVMGLELSKGKMIFILGKSGSGKSTLLETLGLMNNTMCNGSDVSFFPMNEAIDISGLWKQGDEKIAGIRNNYFSFIFQNTNLMPNFSAFENIAISNLIQGKSMKDSMGKIAPLIEKLGLESVTTQKKTFELSGGEQQRVAFIRAIISDFIVLFGDEPTGNLDEYNARELIEILKMHLDQNRHSAILVSHDFDLATEFGDEIVLIRKQKKGARAIGIIDRESVFKSRIEDGKKYWIDHKGNKISDIKALFRKELNN